MKKYSTKQDVYHKMGINDVSEIVSSKIPILISLAPKIDSKVLKELMMQLPEFKESMKKIYQDYKQLIAKIFEQNTESNKYWYENCNKAMDMIDRELQRDNISDEYRDKITDYMMQIIEMQKEKDTENKNFAIKVLQYTVATIGCVTTTCLAVAYLVGVAQDEQSRPDTPEKIFMGLTE